MLKELGDAIKCALSNLIDYSSNETSTLILSGDTPLLTTQTKKLLLQDFSTARIMTTQLQDPYGYGRIIFNNNKKFQKIVEHKDCNKINHTILQINQINQVVIIDNKEKVEQQE